MFKVVHRFTLLALVAFSVLFTAPVAHATTYQGKAQLFCRPQANQQVDPLADYGVNPTPHLHTPVGAVGTFSATETLAQLEGATTTSCDLGSDLSQLWAPTPMKADGTPATIRDIAYYFINNQGQTISSPSTFNPGLRFLLGNPSCATISCASASFVCIPGNGFGSQKIPAPTQCPAAYQETFHVGQSPQCWDGASLGLGFGASTPAATLIIANPCTTLYTIPSIVMTMTVEHDGTGGYLSSDYVPSKGIDNRTTCPGCTAHFDYAFNVQSAPVQALINRCMYVPTINQNFLTCREGPLAAGGTGTESLYINDPATNKAEDGLSGEPYNLVTP